MVKYLLKLRNRHILLLDIIIFAAAPIMAYLLWWGSLDLTPQLLASMALYAGLAVGLRPLVYYRLGLYQRYWAYASADELWRVALAAFLSSLLVNLVFWVASRLQGPFLLSPAVTALDFFLVLALSGASRFSIRLAHWRRHRPAAAPIRILIFGAGDAGSQVAREILAIPQLGHRPVAFLDDDPRKHNSHIYGLPVLGGRDQLPTIVQEHNINCVVIAIPSAPGRMVRQIAELCQQVQVDTRILPGLAEFLNDQVTVDQLRHLAIEDLLRREPVRTDIQAVRQLLAGQRVLVTGGGGSIGRELCRQILNCHPEELIVLGHGENSVFEACDRLRQQGVEGSAVTPVIADVRFIERLRQVFDQTQPGIVFHAAAHKHVPLMEASPAEAVANNVLGTQNLLSVAREFGVDRLVMISTDKAVNPVSVMGATKRVAELLVTEAAGRLSRPFVTVRFGNVLGSRGSVVLTFKAQIAAGGPVTVTHPAVSRYFMTIPEAVQLVLQAAVLGQGGEVFVLDMGQPVLIADLARDMIRLAGRQPGREVALEYIGLRPGEKMHEELFAAGEQPQRTRHDKIYVAANGRIADRDEFRSNIQLLLAAARQNEAAGIIGQLGALVPAYHPAASQPAGPAFRRRASRVSTPASASD